MNAKTYFTGKEKAQQLSKREYIALHAMNGLLSKYHLNEPGDQNTIAQMAVELADALIEELEKQS